MSIRIFFFCEAKFATVRWKLTLLDMVHGSTFCSVFAAVGSFEALSRVSVFFFTLVPCECCGTQSHTGVARNAAKNTWKSDEPHVEIEGTGAPQLRLGRIIKHHQGYICNHWDYLYLFVGIVLFSSIVML